MAKLLVLLLLVNVLEVVLDTVLLLLVMLVELLPQTNQAEGQMLMLPLAKTKRWFAGKSTIYEQNSPLQSPKKAFETSIEFEDSPLPR